MTRMLSRFMFLAAVAALSAANALAYDNIEFVGALQDKGFKNPASVASHDGRVFVADSKAKAVFIFSLADGKLVATATGSGNETLKAPRAAAVSYDGRLYVLDGDRVVIMDKDGQPQGWFGGSGSEPGMLASPEGIAVGPDGRVFVADTRNHRVQVYGANGIFNHGFDAADKGGFSRPTRIQVDPSGTIYVLDDGGERLRKFNLEGGQLAQLKVQGSAMSVDKYGFLYAVDPDKGKVFEYGPDGRQEGTFGTAGKGPGQFRSPTDIANDGAGGILVADPGNLRVLRFRVENSKKTAELPGSRATRIGLVGPVWSSSQKVGPFVPLKEGLFGYHLGSKELVRLDEKGEVALRFGKTGKEAGQVREPKALAWTKEHGVFVSDTGNNRIQFFSSEGKPTGMFGEKAGFFDSRSKEGRVSAPEGIAVSEKGTVYVADVGNQRIQAFSSQGVFLFTVGPELGGTSLEDPAVLQWDPKGFLYVLDRELKKVFKLEANGKFVKSFGKVGEGLKEWQEPVAMAFDGQNYLYILDREAARLKVYDTEGNWVASFFSRGEGERSLKEPDSLAFQGHRLFISDPGSSRVLAFNVRPVLAPPPAIAAAGAEGAAELSWEGSTDPWVKSFHVERSTQAEGPFAEVGAPVEPKFKDSPELFYATYYYRIAAEAKTGDVGPFSNVVPVYVPGSFNVAPVEIGSVDLTYIFSANYKYYLTRPLGKITLSNNVEQTFKNGKLTFFLKDFMDFPSTLEVPELKPRAKTDVKLTGTLNNRILDVSEDTPILAEFKYTYYEAGKEQSVQVTKPVKVLSRNAIIWDRPERMANFVTPNDDPIVDFRAAALSLDPKRADAPRNVQLNNALLIWSALSSQGVGFQPDPVSPYAAIKGAAEHPLDRVQMPRESLRRKSGECDDLVALLASVFESAGIETALLDYPAHIALMINLRASDALEIGLPEELMVRFADSWWLPVEATMVGKPFAQAVEQGAATFRKAEKAGEARVIQLSEARKEFDPVSLPKEDWRAKDLDAEKAGALFSSDAERLGKRRYEHLKAYFDGLLAKDAEDLSALVGLGVLEAQNGSAKAARALIEKVLALDPLNPAALNNAGNLAYQEKDYAAAVQAYEKASRADPEDAGILLNLARAKVLLGDSAGAKAALQKASSLDDTLGPVGKAILELR